MEAKRLYSIRGAVCAQNSAEDITEQVGSMCRELFHKNNLTSEDILNIQFSVTPDLDALNPATALRRSDTALDTSAVPLFCAQEPVMQNMLPRTIRILVSCYMPQGSRPVPVYLGQAKSLRPDLSAGTGA